MKNNLYNIDFQVVNFKTTIFINMLYFYVLF